MKRITTWLSLLLTGLCLQSCVAPDSVWPDFTDHSPEGYRRDMASHHLCLTPQVKTIAVLSPSVALVRGGSGHAFNMITKDYCFESKSISPVFTPKVGTTDLCVGTDYTVSYIGRDGKQVTCPVMAYEPISDAFLTRDLHAYDISQNASTDTPRFKY